MEYRDSVEQSFIHLFQGFVGAVLHGRVQEAFDFVAEKYTAVGMGEQGIARDKKEAMEILTSGYRSEAEGTIAFELEEFLVNWVSEDVAVLMGKISIVNTSKSGIPVNMGLLQTVGVCKQSGEWKIVFTHASADILTEECAEAYPLRFMDKTLSMLRAQLQEEKQQLHRDILTGVLTREGFELQCEKQMKKYNAKYNTALFMVDLDDFKQINDRLGHQTGDTVLRQMGTVLQDVFGGSGVIGRIGGDEFMVLVVGEYSVKFLEKKADELLHASRLCMGANEEVSVSVSIGVAYGRAKTTFDKLYRIADIAMYGAKRAGKCRYHIINADTNIQRSYQGTGANIISLQALLDSSSGREMGVKKTPYEAVVENVPGGVVMFELTEDSLHVTHCNEWLRGVLGYQENELETLRAENPLAIVHPEDYDSVMEAAQLIRDGADSCNIIYRVRHKDGSYRHMNQVVSVTERKKGSVILYGIESDIEDLINLKQAVEDSKKDLEAFLDSIPGGVISITITGGVHLNHRNDWASRLLGYSKEEFDELEKENSLALVHPDDIYLIEQAVKKMRSGAKSVSTVYRLRGKDQTYRNVRISISLRENDKNELVYYGVITEAQ